MLEGFLLGCAFCLKGGYKISLVSWRSLCLCLRNEVIRKMVIFCYLVMEVGKNGCYEVD